MEQSEHIYLNMYIVIRIRIQKKIEISFVNKIPSWIKCVFLSFCLFQTPSAKNEKKKLLIEAKQLKTNEKKTEKLSHPKSNNLYAFFS